MILIVDFYLDKPLRTYLKNCGSCDRAALIDSLSNLLRKLRNTPDNSQHSVIIWQL